MINIRRAIIYILLCHALPAIAKFEQIK